MSTRVAPTLSDRLAAARERLAAQLDGADDAALAWAPTVAGAPGWSVGEVLQHLTRTAERYLDKAEPAVQRATNAGTTGRRRAIPLKWQKWIDANGPAGPWQPTPATLRPTAAGSAASPSDLRAALDAAYDRLATLLRTDDTEGPLSAIRHANPLSFWAGRIPVTATLRFLVGHLERHLDQIDRIRSSPGYPGPAPAETSDVPWAIVLREMRQLPVHEVAGLLMQTLGLMRIDANRLARRQRGILARQLSEADATQLVAELDRLGIDAEAVEASFLEPPPRARTVYHIDPQPEGLLISKDGADPIPWSDVDQVAVGMMLPSDTIQTPKSVIAGTGLSTQGMTAEEAAAIRDAVGRAIQDEDTSPIDRLPSWLDTISKDAFDGIEKEVPPTMLDVWLTNPARRYRVPAKEMLAGPLGEERTPNWLRNLRTILQRIEKHAPSAALHPSALAFLAAAPRFELTVDLINEFDDAQQWYAFHARQLELEALLADPPPAAPE